MPKCMSTISILENYYYSHKVIESAENDVSKDWPWVAAPIFFAATLMNVIRFAPKLEIF